MNIYGLETAMEIKVSVLCTAYQHEPYIRDALESFVTQQTDFPFEVLVSDDASTDGTAAIIREYAEKYPEIVRPFLLEKNHYSQGINLYDAILFPAARGQYLAACEGDDCWLDPTKLQRQVDFLDAHPAYSACVHNTVAHHSDGRDPDRVLFEQSGDRDIPFSQVVRGMSHAFHTSSIMARRAFIVNPPDFRNVAFSYGFTDYAVGLWLTMNGKVRFLDRPMSLYRIGSNPSAWSSGVDRNYAKLRRFIQGELAMLRAVKPHADAAQRLLVDEVILEREYELLYIEGRVDEMVSPPYTEIHRRMGLSRRVSTALKRALPHLHRWYRKRKGFIDG